MSGEEPPKELLRFHPSQPAPIGSHGRPEPWKVRWDADEFTAWLRTRAAWRDTHSEPLPGLFAQERVAIERMPIPRALVEAEQNAPAKAPGGGVFLNGRYYNDPSATF